MNFIAFDLETTGLSAKQDQIIEIGAVKFENEIATHRFGTLVNPGISIPYGASAVNGITDDMVKNKPTIDHVLEDFALFCGDLPLVAHNASFDFKFLENNIIKYQAPAPKGPVFDTLGLARKLYQGLPNHKLGTLVRHFGFPSGTFHRAEEDSVYCGMLFIKIIQTLKQRGEECSEETFFKYTQKFPLHFSQCTSSTQQTDFLF